MASTQIDVKDYNYFAGNQWRKAADNQVFEVHEPYSGNLFARVAAGSRADARAAVDAAAKAFPAWAQSSPDERARLFLKASEIVRRRRTEIAGPIITRDAVKLIDDRVKDALARGAKAHTGAKHDGQIYYPTILTDVPLEAAIANEETFGPVVVVEVVDTPEEAVAAANRTLYGLTSSILAGNTYKAFELAPKVLAGIVNVNSPTVNDEIHAPMGGVRDSGWGRTGPRSLDDFSDLIWINSHSGQRQYPF